MDDDYEPYKIKVEVRHPTKPTVLVALGWLEGDQPDGAEWPTIGADLTARAMHIAEDMGRRVK